MLEKLENESSKGQELKKEGAQYKLEDKNDMKGTQKLYNSHYRKVD